MSRAFRALSALALLSLPFLPGSAQADLRVVEFADGGFVPAVLTVAVGDTLRLVNRDGVAHTLTADDGSYDSGRLGDGDATQLVLASLGQQGFHCAIGGQRLVVHVEAGRGDSGLGMPRPPTGATLSHYAPRTPTGALPVTSVETVKHR